MTALTADEQALADAQQALLETPGGLEKLRRLRGWTEPAIRRLGLGLVGDRVLIPIRDHQGALCGLLRYAPDPAKRKGQPKTLAATGSQRNLFPAPETLEPDTTIWLVEGEADAIAAHSIGLAATAVPGTSSWTPEWAPRFADRHVVICTDCDSPGRTLSATAAAQIAETATSVRVVDLAPARDDGYDLSDLVKESEVGEEDQVRRLLEQLADKAELWLADADRPPRPRLTISDWRQALHNYLEDEATDPAWPLPWAELNQVTEGGIRPGELWVLAGWTSAGKSLASDAIADSVAAAGGSVHLYLTEMTVVQRGLRAIARRGQLPFGSLRRRHLSARQRELAHAEIDKLPYAASVVTDWTPRQVAADIRATRTNLAVIDLLHGFDYRDERELSAIVSEFAKACSTDTAGLNGSAILLLAQLNDGQMRDQRSNRRPKPGMHSLKGSSWIKQIADVVMFVHREDNDDGDPQDDGEIYIAKNRNGGRGGVPVVLDPFTLTLNAATNDQPGPDDHWRRNDRERAIA